MSKIKKLPKFPEFKKLEVEDYQFFKKITSKFSPYSDYNFVSLWSYNVEDDCLVSDLNGNIVIRFRDYLSNEPFYSFIGTSEIESTINQLMTHSSKNALKLELSLIPEVSIKRHKYLQKIYNMEIDRDNFDYIYHLEHISRLAGDKYSKKKNKLNRFQKDFPQARIDSIDLRDVANHQQILKVFEKWVSNKNNSSEAKHELIAVKRLLNSANYFRLFCYGVYIDDRLIGFTIGELLHRRYSISHFTKADSNFVGVFEFLYKNTADKLLEIGYKYYNREQDLGLEGLRAAKLSWRPKRFLKKYRISTKSIAN